MLHGSELSQGIEAKEIYELRTGSFVSEHKIINLGNSWVITSCYAGSLSPKSWIFSRKTIAAGFKLGAYGNSDQGMK